MRDIRRRLVLTIFIFSFLAGSVFVFSCTDSNSLETGKGVFKLTMIDNPAKYDNVRIVVKKVEVHSNQPDSTGGWSTINNNQGTYDLLALSNGKSVVLGITELDAGQYNQIRFIIGTGSSVVVDGITHLLDIPSGDQTVLKLNHSFEIQPGSLFELILDFDADRSIVFIDNGQYKFRPIISMLSTIITGTIAENVNPLIATGVINAINGTDTVGTIANPNKGNFKLMTLLQQTYSIGILSAYVTYNDTTISNVTVTAEQNYKIGTFTISDK